MGFAIRTEVIEFAALAHLGELHGQLVGQRDGGRHVVFVFVTGVAEHHALVAGATGVDTHGDVGRLRMNGADDGTGVGIKTVGSVGVAHRCHCTAHNRGEIYIGFGGDFTGNDHHARGGQGFAGHTAIGIFFQTGIEDSV